MKQFTVILMCTEGGDSSNGESWCGIVRADNPHHAVKVAQIKAEKAGNGKADDLLPVSVFSGAHKDLIGEWATAQNAANAT